MAILKEITALSEVLLGSLNPPEIRHIHLPPLTSEEENADEFGIVFLEDGSIGPFYCSLEDTLPYLHHRAKTPTVDALPELLDSHTIGERALGIGIFNALSAYLMRKAGFRPDRAPRETGERTPAAGETVGMVGYFCPLVTRLVDEGSNVIVLERQPERVEARSGVTVATNPDAIGRCRTVICTAATLINDSLEEILQAARSAESFSLIGPTASGLPDAVFKHGVTATGGVWFEDHRALEEKLDRQESWGKAGQKFQLTPHNYPGLEKLLAAACKVDE